MADDVELEAALDELLATPPEDFVAARNGLVKALKAAGQKDDAASVAELRKPNRLVWALDQLALADEPALAPLLEAAEIVRDGGGDDLRSAIADLREAVNTAATAAAARLDTRPSDRADLAAALLAVVADEDATDDLSRGRLLEVPAPDAFGLGLSAPAPKSAKAKAKAVPKAKPKPAAKVTDRPPDQLAIRRAAKRKKEAAKEADGAARALGRAEKALEAEASALEEADEELERATAAQAEAEALLAQAKADLEKAEAASAKAVDDQERAAGVLAEAQERAEAAAAELDDATTELDALDS